MIFDLINVFTSSHGGGGPLALLAIGPGTAYVFFRAKNRKYRNFDSTHNFEHDPGVQEQNLEQSDTYIGDRKKTRDAYIVGRNSDNDRKRVNEF